MSDLDAAAISVIKTGFITKYSPCGKYWEADTSVYINFLGLRYTVVWWLMYPIQLTWSLFSPRMAKKHNVVGHLEDI